ncbi:MAG: App1 family protein [Gemmatimonadaceae bacterium]
MRITDILHEAADDLRRVAGSVRGDDPHEIVPYLGYAGATRALVQGRVLEDRRLSVSTASDSLWRNLINTLKRIKSDPIPFARVRMSMQGIEREIVADDEGFFRQWIEIAATPALEQPWQEIEVQFLAPSRVHQPQVRATALLRVPDESATFGVISDLDDTVIQSNITNFLQAARTLMLGNARTRLPFPGVAALYQALERGGDGGRQNPLFYVSSSPWNIYDIIADFIDMQGIPRGPIMLRDWDLELTALSARRLRGHKEPLIREILDSYPSLPFILVGDNGQKDPEIYRSILDHYPGRILAIYIRNVEDHPERSASVEALTKEVLAAGSTLVLADDSYAAATHAADHGWIAKESLPSIREEEKADEGETGTKADVPGVVPDLHTPTIVVE